MPCEFARYQPATPTHSMVATLNRIQNVPSMRLRMLSASSPSCCPIPTVSPAAHVSRSQRLSPAQKELTPAINARTDHARERKARHACSSPSCWLGHYRFCAIPVTDHAKIFRALGRASPLSRGLRIKRG